jgi:hypothetical protein
MFIPEVVKQQASLNFDGSYWLQLARKDAEENGMSFSEECSSWYGDMLLAQFQAKNGSLCAARSGHAAQSSIWCYEYPYKNGLACMSRNILLRNSTAFTGPPGVYRDKPDAAPGTLRVFCDKLQPGSPQYGALETGLTTEDIKWFTNAADFEAKGPEDSSACGPDVLDHPILFVSRLDPTNPYHNMQSVVHVFVSLVLFSNRTAGREMQVSCEYRGLGRFAYARTLGFGVKEKLSVLVEQLLCSSLLISRCSRMLVDLAFACLLCVVLCS